MTKAYEPKATTFLLVQERQVRWFAVRQLIGTALQTLAATVVGSMSGRRELMSALDFETRPVDNYSAQEEIWLDYVADAGDGWNATLSIAWLLGRDALAVRRDRAATPQAIPADQDEIAWQNAGAVPPRNDDTFHLPHGQILIFGGDEVYPTAAAKAYQQRLVDPYRCARYCQNPARDVYALPGNHDWYDGLTSFIRLFCQAQENRRWLGAWGTRQRRSYFAIKLPHGWWLWGVDMALEDDLDPPQYEYFRERSRELAADDQVILCLPTPVWLKRDAGGDAADQIQYCMASKLKIIADLADGDGRARAPVYLTGDNHHYAHYFSRAADHSHYIVCGGGGAFGLGTLRLQPTVEVAASKDGFVTAECETLFPDQATSKRLRWGALKFPLHNVTFTLVLACVQLITWWLLSSAGERDPGIWIAQMVDAEMSPAGLAQAWPGMAQLLGAPDLAFWLLAILSGFGLFAVSGQTAGGPKWLAALAGLAHGVAQILGSLALFWLMIKLTACGFPGLDMLQPPLAVLLGFVATFLYSGTLFGIYLVCGNIFLKLHDQEIFSAQGIEDYKSFLRMRITATGLEIFPIGLRSCARRWRAAPGVKVEKISRRKMRVSVPDNCARVFDPATELSPQLIEAPIFIPRRKS